MRLTIKARLFGTFLLIFALWATATVVAVFQLRSANDKYLHAVDVSMVQMALAEKLLKDKLLVRSVVAEILLPRPGAPSDYVTKLRNELSLLVEDVEKTIREISGSEITEAERAALEDFEAIHLRAKDANARTIQMQLSGQAEAAQSMFHGELAEITDEIVATIDRMIEESLKNLPLSA